MSKSKYLVVTLLLIFFLVGCRTQKLLLASVVIKNVVIQAEVVSRLADLRQGLSGRASLPTDHGMLFVFSKSDIYEFWMKDMKFPLDIIWINTKSRTDADKTRTNADNINIDLRGKYQREAALAPLDNSKSNGVNQRESVSGEIVEVWQKAPLPINNEIPRYMPGHAADYVLEVAAGSLEKYGWQVGDEVSINFKP